MRKCKRNPSPPDVLGASLWQIHEKGSMGLSQIEDSKPISAYEVKELLAPQGALVVVTV